MMKVTTSSRIPSRSICSFALAARSRSTRFTPDAVTPSDCAPVRDSTIEATAESKVSKLRFKTRFPGVGILRGGDKGTRARLITTSSACKVASVISCASVLRSEPKRNSPTTSRAALSMNWSTSVTTPAPLLSNSAAIRSAACCDTGMRLSIAS